MAGDCAKGRNSPHGKFRDAPPAHRRRKRTAPGCNGGSGGQKQSRRRRADRGLEDVAQESRGSFQEGSAARSGRAAHQRSSARYSKQASKEQEKRQRAWKRSFAVWSQERLKQGARLLKPAAAVPSFSAADMREEWRPRWQPEDSGRGRFAEGWREAAADAELPREEAEPKGLSLALWTSSQHLASLEQR